MRATPQCESLFVTKVYRAEMAGQAVDPLIGELEAAALSIAEDDTAGRAWSAENGYPGYTSYASLADLTTRMPPFAELAKLLERHVAAFADDLDLDLGRRRLKLDSMWLNVLGAAGHHTSHIHPNAVVSGTFYVAVPKGAGALKLEDPRLAMMMAAPPRKATARRENANFIEIEPERGTLLMWESWLRHEVRPSRARRPRISISFNWAVR